MVFEYRLLSKAAGLSCASLGLLIFALRDFEPAHPWGHIGIFCLLSAIGLAGTSWGRQLDLDLVNRAWTYRQGLLFCSPKFRGTFDDIGGVVMRRFDDGEPEGFADLVLEMRDWPGRDELFVIEYVDLQADVVTSRHYAERLGVPLIDRTTLESAP